jgi:hypothetical protein
MSPAATMDNSMPSSSSSLFNIPQLAEDGSNWVTYKHCMTIALGARRLGEYVDGTAVRPILITTATSQSGITATLEEVKENKREVAEYIVMKVPFPFPSFGISFSQHSLCTQDTEQIPFYSDFPLQV